MPRKGGAQKMKKLVFSVLTVLILAGCEKTPAPATDPVPTPQESLSSEESQSSSVYVKEPQTTVFDGRSYTCTDTTPIPTTKPAIATISMTFSPPPMKKAPSQAPPS